MSHRIWSYCIFHGKINIFGDYYYEVFPIKSILDVWEHISVVIKYYYDDSVFQSLTLVRFDSDNLSLKNIFSRGSLVKNIKTRTDFNKSPEKLVEYIKSLVGVDVLWHKKVIKFASGPLKPL